MARFRHPQNNFTGGEISPKAFGRSDTAEYGRAAEIIQNALVLSQGGATYRPGAENWVDKLVFYLTQEPIPVRGVLIPYYYSESEKYLLFMTALEFHAAYPDPHGINVYAINVSTKALVTDFQVGGVSYDLTTKYRNVGFDIKTLADVQKIQFSQKGALLYLYHPSGPPCIITRTALNTFAVNPFWDPPAPGTTASSWDRWPYRDVNIDSGHLLKATATTGTIALQSLNASGGGVNFFDIGMLGTPFYLADTGGPAWGVCTPTVFTSATQVTAIVNNTLPTNYTTGNGHTEWSEGAWSDYRGWPRTGTFFEARKYFISNEAEPGRVWASEANDLYQMTRNDTDIMVTGTVVNTDPLRFDIDTDQFGLGQWAVSGRTLTIGTMSDEHLLAGTDQDDIIGPLNPPDDSSETSVGSSYVQPVRNQNATYFVQRSAKRVREFQYNASQDAYAARDLSVLAEHISSLSRNVFNDTVEPKIVKLVIQQGDSDTLWALDVNGFLFAATIEKDLEVLAWHRQEIAGVRAIHSGYIRYQDITVGNPTQIVLEPDEGDEDDHGVVDGDTIIIEGSGSTPSIDGTYVVTHLSGNTFSIPLDSTAGSAGTALTRWSKNTYDTKVKVDGIAVMPSDDNTHDDVFITVQRAINGNNRTSIERMTAVFDGDRMDEQSTAVRNKPLFLDGGVMSQVASFPNGTATTAHTGFDYWAGHTVDVVADGKYIGQKTVSAAGGITLDTAAQEVLAGLKYDMKLKLLPFEAGSVLGAALTAVQRVEKVLVKLYKTISLKIGRSFDAGDLEEILFNDVNQAPENTIPLYTGVKEADFTGDYERESQVCILHDVPYPCTVSAVVAEGVTYDD